MEHQTDSKQEIFMETKYMDGKSLSLYNNPEQCQVLCPNRILTTLGDYISNNIQTTNPHHTKCTTFYMTAYLLAASGCDRCGPCATYQLIWLICAMIACGPPFYDAPTPRKGEGGRARNRNRPLPDLRSAKVSVPQCSVHLLT